MADPINPNIPSPLNPFGQNPISSEGVSTSNSPATNIPNAAQNRQWFLSENSGSRTEISATDNALSGIDDGTGIDAIANRILSHIGA